MSEKRRDNRGRILHKYVKKYRGVNSLFLHLNLHLLPTKLCHFVQLYAKIAYLRNGENIRKDKEIEHDKSTICLLGHSRLTISKVPKNRAL